MRIGFDAKRAFHNTTGLGNYSRDLIRILATYYPSNEYFLYNTKPKKTDRLQLLKNMKEVLPKSVFWKKFSSIWRQGPITKQIVNDEIIIYHGLSGEIPRNIHKKGVKTVVTIHDLIFVRYPELYSSIDRKIYLKKFEYAANNADIIIAISEQTKLDIVRFLKVDASKIKVIYQGCHAVFKEKSTKEEINLLKNKYNLPESFILNVGTIEERKNVLSAVKAIKNVDTSLVIVGRKTNYYNEIKEYITDNKMLDRVFFLEGVSLKELSTLYQLASIFVYPSVFEGFGIPIIEALYSKIPVITTKGGVFPEAGGPNSIYVNSTDTLELKRAIVSLLNSEQERKKISALGFDFVQKFNDDFIAKNIINVYKTIE